MNESVSVIALYFALISFLGGIFFSRLDNWYNEIRSKRALAFSKTEYSKDTYFRLREALLSLKSSKPLSGFIGFGSFTTFVAVLGIFIPVTNPPFDPIVFLYMPLVITVLIYWIFGILILFNGSRLIREAEQEVIVILKNS
jgi:hypothetical protein